MNVYMDKNMYKKDIILYTYFQFIIFYAFKSLEQYLTCITITSIFILFLYLFFALFMLILINENNFYDN